MVKRIYLFLVLFLFQLPESYSQVMFQVTESAIVPWYYLGGDEFDGQVVDTLKWNTSFPWGRTLFCNKELQYYNGDKNIAFKNGALELTVKRENIEARAVPYEADNFPLKCDDRTVGTNMQQFSYTSGMIFSRQKYGYGYYEMRFKSDEGRGLWPAFWLYTGNGNDEIDIMEIKGERNNDFHVDVHCKSGCNNYKTFLGLLRKNWGDYLKTSGAWNNDFNVIGLEWNPAYIKWFLNGQPVAYWKGHIAAPAWVIANLAVASNDGPFSPGPDASTSFPSKYEIDYIRIWSNIRQDGINVPHMQTGIPGDGKATLVKKSRPEYKRSRLKNEIGFININGINPREAEIKLSGSETGKMEVEISDARNNTAFRSANSRQGKITGVQWGRMKLKVTAGKRKMETTF